MCVDVRCITDLNLIEVDVLLFICLFLHLFLIFYNSKLLDTPIYKVSNVILYPTAGFGLGCVLGCPKMS